MRKLYECRDRLQAQILHDALASQHIETIILGDYLTGAAGELSAIQFPVIWVVKSDDYYRARQLINQHLEGSENNNEIWCCQHCGEEVEGAFQICWNCLSPRN
ncbi:MAG: DUF2007 domain-containing protein [Sedimenticola sp.]|nr:DUF2007 domain-containing protein [Sedimenticola sp.]